jgi:hypothetical protein
MVQRGIDTPKISKLTVLPGYSLSYESEVESPKSKFMDSGLSASDFPLLNG